MLGAIIGAVASIGGALLSSSATKKAANKAADAQVQVANQNNALAREFRASNTANFQPNLDSGFRANALIDSFLYGPQAAPPAAQQQVAPASEQNFGATVNPDEFIPDYSIGMSPRNALGARNLLLARSRATMPGAMMPPSLPSGPVAGAVTTNPLSGYDAFRNSPYYQFPLQEGLNSLQQGYAGLSALQSGAAMKDIVKYGQDYGAGRMGEFIHLAENQANRGITGASSIAGVSQNALNTITNNNQNAADALSNAAIARGAANAGMYAGIGNALGNLASSYKGFGF